MQLCAHPSQAWPMIYIFELTIPFHGGEGPWYTLQYTYVHVALCRAQYKRRNVCYVCMSHSSALLTSCSTIVDAIATLFLCFMSSNGLLLWLLSPGCIMFYPDDPLMIVRGEGQYLFDEQGRKYLDCVNNVCHGQCDHFHHWLTHSSSHIFCNWELHAFSHQISTLSASIHPFTLTKSPLPPTPAVGHCHPRVVEAGMKQMQVLSTNNRYLHDNIGSYAQHLRKKLPGDLSTFFFLNSGYAEM